MSEVVCSQACTITLVVSPIRATADEYEAVSVIFGATLVALVVIWGVKAVYRLFVRPTDA